MRNQTDGLICEPQSQKGSILLLTLGVLAVLSLLGSALIFMSKNEQNNARSYMNQTRAQLVAESGIETAVAKLTSFDKGLLWVADEIKPYPNYSTSPV